MEFEVVRSQGVHEGELYALARTIDEAERFAAECRQRFGDAIVRRIGRW